MEYQEGSRNIEQEGRGRNVELHAVFIRHGEKELSTTDPDTALTKEGEAESHFFGQHREKHSVIKSYSSDTRRTRLTADVIVDASPSERKLMQRLRKGLEFQYDPHGEFLWKIMKMKQDIIGNKETFSRLSEEERKRRLEQSERAQANYYLRFGNTRPDPKTYSPVETAASIAELVQHYIDMTERIRSGSSVDLINTTHDFNILSFLSETLVREIDGERVVGFHRVEDIGDPIGFLENFEIIIKRDEEGVQSVVLSFRGHEYAIDQERMQTLLSLAEDLKKEDHGS